MVASRSEPWLPRRKLTEAAVALLEHKTHSVCPAVEECRSRRIAEQAWPPRPFLHFFLEVLPVPLLSAGRWVLTFDISHSPSEDLLQLEVREQIEEMMRAGCFLSCSAGPVCASFSRAVQPPVRSKAWRKISNFASKTCLFFSNGLQGCLMRKRPWSRKLLMERNSFARWVASLVDAGVATELGGLGGKSSRQFFLGSTGVESVDRIWQAFLFCHWFLSLGYALAKAHQKLEAPHAFGRILTFVPVCLDQSGWGLSLRIVQLFSQAVAERLKPESRRATLDAAACARCCTRRIGEAKNPGPRNRRFANATWSVWGWWEPLHFYCRKECMHSLWIGWKLSCLSRLGSALVGNRSYKSFSCIAMETGFFRRDSLYMFLDIWLFSASSNFLICDLLWRKPGTCWVAGRFWTQPLIGLQRRNWFWCFLVSGLVLGMDSLVCFDSHSFPRSYAGRWTAPCLQIRLDLLRRSDAGDRCS